MHVRGHGLCDRRLFFGHQSVGTDLLDGLRDLPQLGAHLSIVRTRDPSPDQRLLAHDLIGTNGAPETKLTDFCRALDNGIGDWADVAMMKFCYVDVTTVEQAEQLFNEYAAVVDRLEQRHPRLVISHCTIPLRSFGHGLVDLLRRLRHGGDPEVRRNLARESFNERIRRRYDATGRLFDLAALESRNMLGRQQGRRFAGRFVPSLAREYSDDGGHLNDTGRRRMAAAFASFLETQAPQH